MPTLFERGESFRRRNRLQKFAGICQIWRDRVKIGTDVPAKQAQTIAEVEAGDVLVESRLIDWLIERTDYGDPPVEPIAGDILEVVFPDGETRYFICASFGSEVPWRWHDRNATSYRIHTRQANENEVTGGLPGGGHFGLHFGSHFGTHFGGNFP